MTSSLQSGTTRRLPTWFDVKRRTMPQNDPGSLNERQVADVLAFVLHKANYPAGTQDLPTDVATLKMYRFLANKPGAQK